MFYRIQIVFDCQAVSAGSIWPWCGSATGQPNMRRPSAMTRSRP